MPAHNDSVRESGRQCVAGDFRVWIVAGRAVAALCSSGELSQLDERVLLHLAQVGQRVILPRHLRERGDRSREAGGARSRSRSAPWHSAPRPQSEVGSWRCCLPPVTMEDALEQM
eukprot:4438176-Prymnesium_polylepis.1